MREDGRDSSADVGGRGEESQGVSSRRGSRRRFSAEEKARVVHESFRPGQLVGEVAHRYLSPNEFECRAATGRPTGTESRREQTNLEPFRIGRPGSHNHPLGRPSTPVSERDFIPSAIVHPSAGGDSPQPSTESG